ncbi:hypothetical protein [Paraclostridium dentum]|uniref:hypothetical protein n=1 Tax=Paraclostridium dentum TaxID=2662455 RepID=UPI0034649DFE
MSSTNRSRARDTHISDYYVTPIEEIEKFLGTFLKIEIIDKDIKILDPAAGGDKIHKMSYVEALNKFGFNNIDTIDIRKDSLAQYKQDYLTTNCKNKYNMIITNPPFSLAMNFIQKALDDVKDNGWVIMLLRLNFFGGKQRFTFWQHNMPKYCFVHHKRMSFTDDGKTDSIEYCHMVWQKGYKSGFTQLKVI